MGMPRAWEQGYEWAQDKGDVADLECTEAMEKLGIDFDTEDAEVFMNGADQGFIDRSASHDQR